jgi:surface protein
MANIITNHNIRSLATAYINDGSLPAWLQDIDISNWDVSNVTNMDNLFRGLRTFNKPLTNWNVSNVRSMRKMFQGCRNFNQPLNNWYVSNVEYMTEMFNGCTSFNQPLNNWTVSNVEYMTQMFNGCTSFNQPLNNWNVSNVREMIRMFKDCINFNQPLDNWNVSNVTDMNNMFRGCTSFNQPLNNWNVSNVTGMSEMFRGCTSFNQPLNNWNVSNVTGGMSNMFRGCVNFNINPRWQINQLVNTDEMFDNTPLQGTVLRRVQVRPSLRQQQQQPAQQLPQGIAFEIHDAFPELNFNKFMTIIRRDNNDASNFKDATYPLQPLITYINNDRTTTLDATEKTSLTSDLNGEIKRRLNTYLSQHHETKNNVMEMIQFIMSQGSDYKDPYIRFLIYDCMNAYGPRGVSCTKGVFERVFLINKSVLISLCSDDTSSSSASSRSTCKKVYRELLDCFYPDMDLNDLFGEWYKINNMEEGSTSLLANASEEKRKEDFRIFILSKAPRADPTAINKYIEKNKSIFKKLLIGGRKRRKSCSKRSDCYMQSVRKSPKNNRNSLNKNKGKTLKTKK